MSREIKKSRLMYFCFSIPRNDSEESPSDLMIFFSTQREISLPPWCGTTTNTPSLSKRTCDHRYRTLWNPRQKSLRSISIYLYGIGRKWRLSQDWLCRCELIKLMIPYHKEHLIEFSDCFFFWESISIECLFMSDDFGEISLAILFDLYRHIQ